MRTRRSVTFGMSGDPLVVTVTMACGTFCLARAIQSMMRLSVKASFIRKGSIRRSPGSREHSSRIRS